MFERVKTVLEDFIGDEGPGISPETALVDDLGLSSLDVVNLVVAFEDEFGIEIPERVIPTMRTVQDIVRYLESHAK